MGIFILWGRRAFLTCIKFWTSSWVSSEYWLDTWVSTALLMTNLDRVWQKKIYFISHREKTASPALCCMYFVHRVFLTIKLTFLELFYKTILLKIRLTITALTVLCIFEPRHGKCYSLCFRLKFQKFKHLIPMVKKLPYGTLLAVKWETKNRFHSAKFSHDFLGFGNMIKYIY